MADERERHERVTAPRPERGVDERALEAAERGDVPPPAPGMAGESAPGEPSRAEIFALDPGLAADEPLPATPSIPESPRTGPGQATPVRPVVNDEPAPGPVGRDDPVEAVPRRDDQDARERGRLQQPSSTDLDEDALKREERELEHGPPTSRYAPDPPYNRNAEEERREGLREGWMEGRENAGLPP